jgi:hypothetical protein
VHAIVALMDDCPAAHAVHVVPLALTAPVPAPISTTDPAGHIVHATVDTLLYWPTIHAVQLLALAAASVSVTDPAGHTAHATVDTLLY